MYKLIISAILATFISMSVLADGGMTTIKSAHDVSATADRLEVVLKKKGMTVFARIDHSAGAKKVGKELRPTEVVIFGNPKVGTPLMKCKQSVAIDLPQKALVFEDEKGDVWLSYNNPQYLVKRHAVEGCAEVVKKISGALAKFSKVATSP